MVESVDEPPLRGLHSWAKNFLTPRLWSQKSNPSSNTLPVTAQNTLPQHAGDTDQVRQRTTNTDARNTNIEDTKSKGSHVVDKKGAGAQPATMNPEDEGEPKAPVHQRFIRDAKRILFASWINWLLLFVPLGIILGGITEWGGMDVISPNAIFAINAVAIIPLASMLAYATESVALRMGDTWGALLNVTFGNAIELIIFIIGLTANEVRVVQAAAVGSILSNLLLILGMSFVLGGLRYREQLYNKTVSQTSACLLGLSVVSLLLPTAFHAAFADSQTANRVVLKVSRGTSVILLIVYGLYLLFQLKSHAFMYASTPQHVIDEESYPGLLGQMLDSSSSSDSDSSSSDSDATAGSYKAANRIKRALRRRRRTSSSSTRIATPAASVNNLNADVRAELPQAVDEAVVSGDEADEENNRRRSRGRTATVHTRDFEDENSSHKLKRPSKKSKKVKVVQKPTQEAMLTNGDKEKVTPTIQVEGTDRVQIEKEVHSARPHLHARNLSSAIKPVLSSANFPHHEALTRSLAPPALRAQDHIVSRTSMRRASSMPDIHRLSSPLARPPSPRPISQLKTVDGEVQIVETVEAHPHLSTTSAVVMLVFTTGLVALCAEFLVGSIQHLVQTSGLSQAFIGLIILPIVGNAAEHVTAVTVAFKNKMDLSINIALGSSIQIALFVTPLMVMLGWAIGAEMSLYFSLFETMSLFASAFIVGYLLVDGRSNWLEGTLLIAVYFIIAICAFFIPTCGLSDTNGLVNSPQC